MLLGGLEREGMSRTARKVVYDTVLGAHYNAGTGALLLPRTSLYTHHTLAGFFALVERPSMHPRETTNVNIWKMEVTFFLIYDWLYLTRSSNFTSFPPKISSALLFLLSFVKRVMIIYTPPVRQIDLPTRETVDQVQITEVLFGREQKDDSEQ